MKKVGEHIDWEDEDARDFRDLSDLDDVADTAIRLHSGLHMPLISAEAVQELSDGLGDDPVGRPGTLRPTPVIEGGLEVHFSSPQDLAQL